MRPIDRLYQELDEWNFAGEEAMLWWRDDDAVESTSPLTRLLDLSTRFDVPLALAVIPDMVKDSLVATLSTRTLVTVLQHGIAHQNRAPAGAKKQELVGGVEVGEIVTALKNGFDHLGSAFGERFCPVLVPPWNRIDQALLPLINDIGFRGLSTFTPRPLAAVGDEVWVINTHADLIDWKGGRQFIGEQAIVDQLVGHLAARRLGKADRAEPTGLLTHHLVHDEQCWRFLDTLLDALDQHPAVTWLSAERAFQTRWR